MKINNTFEVVIIGLSTISIFLETYTLFIIIKKSPSSMKDYRYFLALYTFFDLCFSFTIGYILAPTVYFPLAGCLVNGLGRDLSEIFGYNVLRLSLTSVIACGGFVLFGQTYCLIYRYLVLNITSDYYETFISWRCKFISFLFMALIIVGASIPIYMGTFSAETLPRLEHFVDIGVDYTIPDYKKLVVFDLGSQVTVGISQVVGVLICILQIISFVCVFRIFRNLSENVQKYSKKSLSLHRQLTRALLLQFLSPFACIFLPVGTYFMALMAVQLPVSNTSGQIGVVMITIFPLVNASITILFISPFRKYTMTRLQTLTQIFGFPRKNTPIVVFPVVKNFSLPSA